ncbi:MAG: ABC transporter permease [Chloroflexi bacterium]|nr:ABC transporter permease [Chloroflexota bacterium]
MNFFRYLVRRLLLIVPLLLGITIVAFIIANAVPADPINANLPQNALGNQELVDAFRKKWGLDKPLHEQYLTYLGNLLRGDMGMSIKTRKPIREDIARFLPATIELATLSVLLGAGLGVGLGLVSAVWKDTLADYVARVVALIGVSFPVFLLALVALTVFHTELGIAAGPGRLDYKLRAPPTVTGMFTIDALLAGDRKIFNDALAHLVLPSLTLALYISGIISRITRSSLLEVLNQEYMRTARAKGLRERKIIGRHGMRNALIPVVTVIGLAYGNLLVGSILIESIFAWPGIGRYMFRASTSQDFPAIMGVSLLIAVIYVGVNFVVDIAYYFLDPRIRIA